VKELILDLNKNLPSSPQYVLEAYCNASTILLFCSKWFVNTTALYFIVTYSGMTTNLNSLTGILFVKAEKLSYWFFLVYDCSKA